MLCKNIHNNISIYFCIHNTQSMFLKISISLLCTQRKCFSFQLAALFQKITYYKHLIIFHVNFFDSVIFTFLSYQIMSLAKNHVITTPFWTQGPLTPSRRAGHKYVRIWSDFWSDEWKRTCTSGRKWRFSYSIT